MTGPIIRTCSPDPEGRAEILCGLRTEISGAFSMQWLLDLRTLSCGTERRQSRSGVGGFLYSLSCPPNPAFGRGVALACGAGNPDCAGDLSLLVGLDYINPSRREVAGWFLLSEFGADLVR